MKIVWLLIGAVALDLIIGDPAWIPHPIRGIGWLIAKGEKLLRALFPTRLRLAGKILAVGVPLITLLIHIDMKDIQKVLTSPQFQPMVINSLCTTILATLLSVSLAFVLAWFMNRSHIRHRSVFTMLFTLPMLIPSISHGMGLVLLFGDNGIISNLLHMRFFLYGYVGIILGSILYSFPVAFLMLNDTFQYEDYTTYEAASVLGLSKRQQFFTITLPNIKGPLISVIFSVFTMIFTDYGVPLVVGGKSITLPVYMS